MNITSEDDKITILFDMKSLHKLYHICRNNSCTTRRISWPPLSGLNGHVENLLRTVLSANWYLSNGKTSFFNHSRNIYKTSWENCNIYSIATKSFERSLLMMFILSSRNHTCKTFPNIAKFSRHQWEACVPDTLRLTVVIFQFWYRAYQ